MGHTPFSLVYGFEAMLPTEVEHKSFRVQQFNEEQSDDSRVDELTRLESSGHLVRKAPTSHETVSHAKHQFTQLSCWGFHFVKDAND
jgi:hypothetical protein